MTDAGGDWRLHLAVLLSTVSGIVDLLGFVSLGRIFTAHVTGNLVMVPASFFGTVNATQAAVLPVFVAAVAATWFLAKTSGRQGPALARYMLAIQFLLLCAVLLLGVITHPSTDPRSAVTAPMALVAVCAMACQHSLLRLADAPSTAVMTGNLTNAVLSVLDSLALRKNAPLVADARRRMKVSLYLLTGFFGGCVMATLGFHWFADWAWLLPVVVAGAAIVVPAGSDRGPTSA